MTFIQHVELTGSQANIVFNSIPNTFTDLYLVMSLRSDTNGANTLQMTFNGVNSGYSLRRLRGLGSGSGESYSESAQSAYNGYVHVTNPSESTASTFSNLSFYIPNYTANQSKSFSVDSVTENNGTTAYQLLVAGLWSNNATISSINFAISGASYVSGSSATLYGILKGSSGGVTVS
jgi:hypothetical protein